MKKRWQRWIALVLSGMLCLSMIGCGKDETTEEQDNQTEQGTLQETTPAESELASDGIGTEENGSGTETGSITPDMQPVAQATTLQDVWLNASGAPTLTASAAVLVEPETGTILFEKNMKEKMYPASMTKILTALVVMDYFQPDELITVGTEINEVSLDSSKAGHVVGETLTIENAIRGLIIPSGNDSANVLAAATARKAEGDDTMSFARCEAVFTDMMNQKAAELGAVNTHFSNAHGYHDENHYTCAYDMALFSIAFMQNETLAQIASEQSFSGDGANGMFANDTTVTTQEYHWISHNLLITDNEYQYAYANGIKTGFTDEAGECLAASAEKDGTQLISVIFHTEDPARWQESTSLLEYGFNQYARVELTAAGATIQEIPLTKHNKNQGDTIALVYPDAMVAYLPTNAVNDVTMSVEIMDAYRVEEKDGTVKVKAPIAKGDAVATVTYTINGTVVAQKTAYAGADIEKGTIFNTIQYFFQSLFANLFSLRGLITLFVVLVILAGIYLILRRMRYGRHHRRNAYTFKSQSRRRRRRWK